MEVFRGGGRAFLLKEGLGAGEVFGVGALAEADGPVGAVEEAVFGEGVEDACGGFVPVGFVPEVGEFGVDVGAGFEGLEGGVFLEGEVVENDAKGGDGVVEAGGGGDDEGAADGIEGEVGFGEAAEVVEEDGAAEVFGEGIPADPDAEEEGVGAEAGELLGEGGLAGFEAADEAADEGVAAGEFEDPGVVLDPGGGFDDDGAGDAEGLSEGGEFGGEDGSMEERVGGWRPGDALGAGGVVEVDVGIEDG